MIQKHLENVFYFLYKDYGTQIQLVKIGKGAINEDTGIRSTSQDKIYSIDAIFTPVDTYVEFLKNLLGRTESGKTDFMIKLEGLPTIDADSDYVKHGNLVYRNLRVETFGGVVGILTGEAFK